MSSDYTRHLPAVEIIEPLPPTVSPGLPLLDAIRLMDQLQATKLDPSIGLPSGYALVVEDKAVVGMITPEDLIKRLASEPNLADATVGAVMSSPISTLNLAQCQDWLEILEYLQQNSLQFLPVVDQEELIGVVTLNKLQQVIQPLSWLKQLQLEAQHSQAQLKPQIEPIKALLELSNGNLNSHTYPHQANQTPQPRIFTKSEEAPSFYKSALPELSSGTRDGCGGVSLTESIGEMLARESSGEQAVQNKSFLDSADSTQIGMAEINGATPVVQENGAAQPHKSFAELERFFAVTPTIFCIAGLDGYFRRVNPAFSQTLGYDEAELLAEPFVNFIHPDDRQATVAEIESLAAGQTTLGFENRYRTADGSYRWFLWKATPYLEEQIIYAAATDITERKQTELALKESEERWLLALRGANDGIWDWNVRTDEVFFSERWKTMLGFEDHEITNSLEEWSKRVHPDDLDWVKKVIKAHFARQTPFYISEHRVQCKDGSYKWILDRGQALWDEAGNVLRMTGSHTDITERKQAELELKQERDFTNAILDTVGALVAVVDQQGRIVRFNRTCEQITGWSEAEVQGKSVWDFLMLDQEKSAVQAIFSQLLDGQGPNQYENHWVGKDGTLHLIAWSNTALFDEQGVVEYVVATGIDVTEPRQVQARLEQQYRQTQIIAEITRKIRVSIKLEEILQTSVEEIQNLLVCDRVMLVKQQNSSSAIPIQEAVLPQLPSMLGYQLSDPLLLDANLVKGEVLAIEDLNQAEIEPAVRQLLQYFQIQAILVVPILRQNQLEALLVAHQCTCTRAWQPREISLLQQLADQIAVALSQAQLLDRLEELVAQRTTDLIATNQQLLAEIEQHQHTEAALRESQQKLSGILDNASEAIISVDQQQRIQLFNQGAEKMFGYPAGEIMSEPLDLLLPQAFQQIHQQYIDSFGNSNLNGNMGERNGEVYGLRKDGSTFPAEASISKLRLRDGLLFTVILKDISDRKQAEAAIHRSEAQLRLITNALPSLIAYIDHQQQYQFNNRAHEDWFGKSSEQINGCHLKDVLDEIAYNSIRSQVEKALSGESVQFELDLSYQAQPRWLSICFIPDMSDDHQVKGFFAMCNDISEQKAIEQIKSEFVSVASHEMRTPLTSIHGVLKLLQAGKLGTLNESGLKMVEIALKNTDRLIRLINDVLDLERMESSPETMQRQRCNSSCLVQQAVETMQPMAEKHQITLVVDAEAVELWADGDRIIQTLTNLLSNAIKFSPTESQVKLAVRVQKDQVLFMVKDSGRGIPADQLETIFERFKQVDASDSRKKGGTGLGLAICRYIVQQHGGHIWALSTLGRGSTFYFTVPRSLSNE